MARGTKYYIGGTQVFNKGCVLREGCISNQGKSLKSLHYEAIVCDWIETCNRRWKTAAVRKGSSQLEILVVGVEMK